MESDSNSEFYESYTNSDEHKETETDQNNDAMTNKSEQGQVEEESNYSERTDGPILPRDSVIDSFKLNEPIMFTPRTYTPCSNYLIQETYNHIQSTFDAKSASDKAAINEGIINLKSLFTQLKSITTQIQQNGAEKQVDWDQYESLINGKLQIDEVDRLIQFGIPEEIRLIVWQIWSKSNNLNTNDSYYLSTHHSQSTAPSGGTTTVSNKDNRICSESIHEKQIKKDITRNNFYNSLNAYNKLGEITNILKIFSNLHQEIGYNQSMIFIVSPINLIMNELETFNLFNTLMNDYQISKLFNYDMSGLHLMLYKFDRLLELLAPQLFNHLINQGIKSSMYASQWFLTFFSYKLPVEIVLIIYDHIVFENIDYLLKFSINLLLQNYQLLMQLKFDQLLTFLKDRIFYKFVNPKYYNQPLNALSTANTNTSASTTPSAGTPGNSKLLPKDYYNLSLLFDFSSTLPQLANLNPNQLYKFELEFDKIWEINHNKQDQINQLNLLNGKLRNEIKYLQLKLSNLNQDHLNLVQSLINLKVKLPELIQTNEDLVNDIENLTEKLESFKASTGITDTENENIPVTEELEAEINKLLVINKQETERNITLEDELNQLASLDKELDQKLSVYKKKWFWNK